MGVGIVVNVHCSNPHDVWYHVLVAYYLLVEQEHCLNDRGLAAGLFGQ